MSALHSPGKNGHIGRDRPAFARRSAGRTWPLNDTPRPNVEPGSMTTVDRFDLERRQVRPVRQSGEFPEFGEAEGAFDQAECDGYGRRDRECHMGRHQQRTFRCNARRLVRPDSGGLLRWGSGPESTRGAPAPHSRRAGPRRHAPGSRAQGLPEPALPQRRRRQGSARCAPAARWYRSANLSTLPPARPAPTEGKGTGAERSGGAPAK